MKTKNSKRTWKIVRPPLHPRFDMPLKKELFDVFEGDEVKLIFEDDEGMGERMWVTVTQCGNSDHWEGTLDNEPLGDYSVPRLKYGSKVVFHPYDVIDVDLVRLRKDDAPEDGAERVPSDNTENNIKRKWFKDPKYVVPSIVGLAGAAATIVAAYL